MNKEDIKPIKPIIITEDLDLTLDDEIVIKVIDETIKPKYQVVVTGIGNENKPNGYYWRSSCFSHKDDAITRAAFISKKDLPGLEYFSTKEFLVEVWSVCDDEDIECIFHLGLI